MTGGAALASPSANMEAPMSIRVFLSALVLLLLPTTVSCGGEVEDPGALGDSSSMTLEDDSASILEGDSSTTSQAEQAVGEVMRAATCFSCDGVSSCTKGNGAVGTCTRNCRCH